MQKILRITFLFLVLFTLSCKKEPDCTLGKIRITSNSVNPYNLYIDGVFKNKIAGNSFMEYDLSEGEHTFKVEQISGYIAFPTVKTNKISIFGCKETQWVFP